MLLEELALAGELLLEHQLSQALLKFGVAFAAVLHIFELVENFGLAPFRFGFLRRQLGLIIRWKL